MSFQNCVDLTGACSYICKYLLVENSMLRFIVTRLAMKHTFQFRKHPIDRHACKLVIVKWDLLNLTGV